MAIFQLLSFLMIMVLLMSMLTRARPWIKAKVTGKVIQVAPLGFWQRLRFYRSTLLALAMGLVLGKAAGWLPDILVLFTLSFALAILCIPMKYTFTTKGVAVGAAIFRPWSEFSGISLKPRQVILENSSTFGHLTLFVRPVDLNGVLPRMKIVGSNQ
jgi:hypothetical protein